MTARKHVVRTGAPEGAVADGTRQDDHDWKQALVSGLPRLRRQRHWTQHDLAEACGLHRETIGRLERPGKHTGDPLHHTLRALALAFNHDDLASFWTALCSAAAETTPGIWVYLNVRQHELIMKIEQCTPEQQELMHVLIAFFRAQLHPRLSGSEPLHDAEALLALLKHHPRRS